MLTCPGCGRESPNDFAFCPACASPLIAPQAREVRKTVTVIFCDVSGSTALGERLDPESLRDVQGRYFDAMRTAIERHGGTVEKYIGDAVMAVFGIPRLHEDDALRAARAAIHMREGLTALNKELERDRGVTIEVRIGVNTGEVVAGDAAAGPALVTGDAVNVAARLEQHAAPGDVLLGDPTYRIVRDAIEAEAVEPLDVKGKTGRILAWRLRAVRDLMIAAPRRLDSPMVGRERQLAQLRQALEAAVDDAACQLFTVLGPAGVGKSRLVQEFLAELGEDASVLRGRCLPYGEGITYFPVVEAIKQAAGLVDFDLPDVVEAKVCALLEGDEHRDLVCRHVSQLLGVTEATADEETFWAIRRYFEVSAAARPLVLVFDDIHWGEPTFLDLVEHIADWSRGVPILLLCMARPDLLDVRPSWGGGKLNAATVSLEPLTGEQAEALIANLLGSTELPPTIGERIVATAEGNPLFVEETLAMLIDDGLITQEGGRWVAAGDLSAVAVPPSIQALLAARLDRLTPDERSALEAAAVVGKEFHGGAVRDLLPEEARPRAASDLMGLVRKQLIRPDRTTIPGEDAFRFRHLLIRDAAYDAIPKAHRADLHERFADWLERVAGRALAEQEEIAGYHLERALAYRTTLGPADERAAAIGRRAAGHLASAGRRAAGRGDHAATANLLRRALAAGPPGPAERAALAYDLGTALEQTGDVRGAYAALDEAIEAADAAGDRRRASLARLRRSTVLMEVDPHAVSTEGFRRELRAAAAEFERLDDDAALAMVWSELAHIEWIPCRYETAERAGRRALEHARRTGDERLIASALFPLIVAQSFGGATPEEGLRSLDELQGDLARSLQTEALALVVRGKYHAMTGELEEGRRLIGLALDTSQRFGLAFSVAAILEELGELEMWAGDSVAAERALRRNYETLDRLGDEGHKSTAAANLARALIELGRLEEAERYAAIAREVAAEDDLASQALGRTAQALVLAARGSPDAEGLAREGVEMFLEAGSEAPNLVGDAWFDVAKVLRMAGKPDAAAEAAREALALYERKGNRPASATVRAFLGKISASG
jgi:class 3 adenylate cyclase/tetratricopeptide (TPR) repeat protein